MRRSFFHAWLSALPALLGAGFPRVGAFAGFAALSLLTWGCKPRDLSAKPLEKASLVTPRLPDDEDPISRSAVAFIRAPSESGILCSGALVATDVVITSAHCFADPRKTPTHVSFGPSIQAPSAQKRRIASWKTYKPTQKFSPNFDIAWARLELAAPQTHSPVGISTDVKPLKEGLRLTVARHAAMGEQARGHEATLQAPGVLKLADVLLGRYVNDHRFKHLLLLRPLPGIGSCKTDPGGPAYRVDKDTVTLVGLLTGADMRLTRDTTCESGEALFTFVAPYLPWLEESAGLPKNTKADTPEPPPVSPRLQKSDFGTDFLAWCSKPVEDEARHTVDTLLVTLGSADCNKALAAARKLTRIDLRAAELVDLRPLSSLAWIEEFDLRGNEISSSTPCPVAGARCLF